MDNLSNVILLNRCGNTSKNSEKFSSYIINTYCNRKGLNCDCIELLVKFINLELTNDMLENMAKSNIIDCMIIKSLIYIYKTRPYVSSQQSLRVKYSNVYTTTDVYSNNIDFISLKFLKLKYNSTIDFIKWSLYRLDSSDVRFCVTNMILAAPIPNNIYATDIDAVICTIDSDEIIVDMNKYNNNIPLINNNDNSGSVDNDSRTYRMCFCIDKQVNVNDNPLLMNKLIKHVPANYSKLMSTYVPLKNIDISQSLQFAALSDRFDNSQSVSNISNPFVQEYCPIVSKHISDANVFCPSNGVYYNITDITRDRTFNRSMDLLYSRKGMWLLKDVYTLFDSYTINDNMEKIILLNANKLNKNVLPARCNFASSCVTKFKLNTNSNNMTGGGAKAFMELFTVIWIRRCVVYNENIYVPRHIDNKYYNRKPDILGNNNYVMPRKLKSMLTFPNPKLFESNFKMFNDYMDEAILNVGRINNDGLIPITYKRIDIGYIITSKINVENILASDRYNMNIKIILLSNIMFYR